MDVKVRVGYILVVYAIVLCVMCILLAQVSRAYTISDNNCYYVKDAMGDGSVGANHDHVAFKETDADIMKEQVVVANEPMDALLLFLMFVVVFFHFRDIYW